MQMKLGPVMYHLNNFQLQENEGDNQGGWRGGAAMGGEEWRLYTKSHEKMP